MNCQTSHAPAQSRMMFSSILPACIVPRSFVVLTLLSAFVLTSVQAATRYWDDGSFDITTNGDGNSDGASGTWNTILKNWDQGSGLAHVAWVNGSNVADINGGSQTLTLGADIVLGGIVQKSGGSSVVISGGSVPYTLTLNITGANTFLAAANDTTGRALTVNAVIAGVVAKNLVLAGTDTVDKLFIGTSQKPAGTYGHSTSGATNGGLGVGAMNAYFAAGSGTLTVTSGPAGFSSWITGSFAGGATVQGASRSEYNSCSCDTGPSTTCHPPTPFRIHRAFHPIGGYVSTLSGDRPEAFRCYFFKSCIPSSMASAEKPETEYGTTGGSHSYTRVAAFKKPFRCSSTRSIPSPDKST